MRIFFAAEIKDFLGPLELKSGKGESGYENVNKKADNGRYYAKARLNLNLKEQTTLSGQGIGFVTARECAIHLASYLKEHPPIPKESGSKKVLPIPSNVKLGMDGRGRRGS